MNQSRQSNRLIDETSPYLLQHARNPVDWYPWGDQALSKAQAEARPILVSIGYSACHWCHVMEHESFEDEQVAQYMNQHYVCIKVDREERPDLDKIYQTAHQLLTQRPGGWPLNVVISPFDHVPFFAGTYFPKQPRHGMPGFVEVLERITDYYQNHKDRLGEHGEAFKNAFAQIEADSKSRGSIDPDVLDRAFEQLTSQYDPVHGGFGAAPKFPHPTNLEVCLRHWARYRDKRSPDSKGLLIVRHTLQSMAEGGLYDQLGGGFCRYSVDDRWMIPHFEKMLYDNAQLLPLFADAWLASGDASFRDVAVATGSWVLRDMQSSEGGYYSTLDADSEGVEGKFYAWTTDELKDQLTEDEWSVAEIRFGLRGLPNFEGKWHLNVSTPLDVVAQRCGIDHERTKALLDSGREKLLQLRNQRQWPGRDEKVLTAWNGLMIAGMAHAGRILERDDFVRSAEQAFDFVRHTLWRKERLQATTKDGKTHLNAYLDDYVFMVHAALELVQARWRDGDLEFAIALTDIILQHFVDDRYGGFYFTSDDHEKLLYRHKPTQDDAMPSGNGVAALVLSRLGHVLGEPKYLRAAEKTLSALSASLKNYPSAHGALLLAAEEYLYPPEIVILRGEKSALKDATRMYQQGYAPRRIVVTIPSSASSLPGILKERAIRAPMTAYVCSGHQCSDPIVSLQELRSHLEQTTVDPIG